MFGLFTHNPNAVGFLEEAPGVKSSTRLKTFMVLIALFAFDYLAMEQKDFSITLNFQAFNLLGLIAAFAPQYLQKIAEMKFGNVPGVSTDATTIKTELTATEQKKVSE